MSGSRPQQTVFVAFAILASLVLAKAVRNPGQASSYKQLWAVGVLTLGLAAAADFAPQLVAPFAVATVIGFVVRNPGILGPLISPSTPAPSKSPATASAR